MAAVAFWLATVAAGAHAADIDPQRRFAEIEATTGGRLGVAAIHIETGRRVTFNGGRTFPMASVRKLPMAMAVLARVDDGVEQLDRRVVVEAADVLVSGGTPPAQRLQAGSQRTIRQLIELMMRYSDNTAAAVLQRTVVSAALTQARLRTLGINGVRVDRELRALFDDLARVQKTPEPARAAAMTKIENDPRDSAVPEAIAELLVLLQQGRALTPASTTLLLDIMQRSETGRRRLRAGLPATVKVADKTGTLGRTANDVGIATLPGGSHLAIAVFVTGAQKPTRVLDDAIAAAGRTAYELLSRDD
jgi:beta-lactamase class A